MAIVTADLAQLAAKTGASQIVVAAIQHASQRTGVDFSYLLDKAKTESSFNPNAKASSSSATGLFQFIDKTWLHMVREHGSECGLDQYADAISGDCKVSDAATRQQILALRKDPSISAYMAAEFTKDNAQQLQASTGAPVGKTELYLAHFLGAGGAGSFLQSYQSNPNTKAANVLPAAAEANPGVFYDKNGNARSLKQIYDHFASKFTGASSAENVAATPTSLPVSPALATTALNNSTQFNLQNSIAQIANINISPAGAMNFGTIPTAAPTGSISAAAMVSMQQQTHQQQLAFLTQIALETMQNTTPSMAFNKAQQPL